jgi:hypothetical protein
MNNVEHQTITSNNESFTMGSYHGISIIIKDLDRYINATVMCNQFNRRFKK